MADQGFAIVLAAGKGTRMKSDMAKVLHPVFFAPMVTHVVNALEQLDLEKIVVVTGHQYERVEEALSAHDVTFSRQEEQLGTGHAVLSARRALNAQRGTVLILCGDTPLVTAETLQLMLDCHHAAQSPLTLMTTILANPANYGRVITDDTGAVLKVVEEKDASAAERLVNEVNAGIYCAEIDFLFSALAQVGTDNAQGEVYLTDIVQITCDAGLKVGKFLCPDPIEITGVNSRVELAAAHKIMQQRRNRELMLQGTTMFDPETILIEPSVTVGTDTIIQGNCYLTGTTTIGAGAVIEPFVRLNNCVVEGGALVKSFSNASGEHFT
jgi:bifunctional UDP-N-acetylglucosamine pyrophosphorylase/glucosamine-1-phosphate N-acetyltransferase